MSSKRSQVGMGEEATLMNKSNGHSAKSLLPKLLTETQVSMIFNVSINTLRYCPPAATRRERVGASIGRLTDAIRRGDDAAVEQAVLQLSKRRRYLAPLAMIVGAFLMLFQGVKLL